MLAYIEVPSSLWSSNLFFHFFPLSTSSIYSSNLLSFRHPFLDLLPPGGSAFLSEDILIYPSDSGEKYYAIAAGDKGTTKPGQKEERVDEDEDEVERRSGEAETEIARRLRYQRT